MTKQQASVAVVQVHAPAQAVAEHRAVGAVVPAGPFPLAERDEAVLPHLPEVVAVDVALIIIRTDRGAARDGACLLYTSDAADD